MARPLSFVRLDIARFGIEITDRPDDKMLADWVRKFHRSLALQRPDICDFASELLKECAEFRAKEAVRKRNPPESAGKTRNPPESDTEQNRAKQKFMSIFDTARKSYPGSKLGLETEWKNFLKNNNPEIAEKLESAIKTEKEHKGRTKARGEFTPEWKNFKTWINAKAWEQDFPSIQTEKPKPKLLPTYDTDRAGYHDMFSFTSKIKKPFPDSPDEPEEFIP